MSPSNHLTLWMGTANAPLDAAMQRMRIQGLRYAGQSPDAHLRHWRGSAKALGGPGSGIDEAKGLEAHLGSLHWCRLSVP